MPQLRRGEQQVSIQRRKDLALLIFLVVTSKAHSRDSLSALLWQDQNQVDARSNLRKSLSRLRGALGEEVLLISQDQVGVNPRLPVETDVAQFSTSVRKVREHKHVGNNGSLRLCDECQQALETAARLYQADFLAGFSVPDSLSFEEWQFFQTESLRKNLAEVLEQLTRHYASGGEYVAAIESARRWLALDRLHEPAHRQLMQLYALSEQRPAALRQFEECRRLFKEELDAEPEQETLQLYRDIQKKNVAASPILPAARPDHRAGAAPLSRPRGQRFPAHPSPLIGRQGELEEIARLLDESSCRLLTLLGPGGSGKTRLALEVGSLLTKTGDGSFDGIWFIPLAHVSEPTSIPAAIIEGMGLARNYQQADARQILLREMRGAQKLLILDNFEQLLSNESIALLREILSAEPRNKILVTSRERLNLEGETLFHVEGLKTPPGDMPHQETDVQSVSATYSSLQLFEECARRVQPAFEIGAENYQPIAQICRTVQGMPLAIELAASWIEIFTPPEILSEIERSLDFLESNWRDLPDRQKSLRAVFNSSWDLLARQTRPVLKALSVFRTSFSREAAQAVSGASARTLLELSNQSWIQHLSNGRYQIHELLRQFAFMKLQKEPATYELVRKRYCEYFASYAANLWEALKGADQRRAFSGLEAEFDNLYTAWVELIANHEVETAIQNMLPVLFHYSELRGKTHELIKLLDMALKEWKSSKPDARQPKHEIILRTARGSFFHDGYPLRYSTDGPIFPIDRDATQRAWELATPRTDMHELGVWAILLAYDYGRIFDLNAGIRTLERLLPAFDREHRAWELATTYLHLLSLLIPNQAVTAVGSSTLSEYLTRARDIFTSLGDAIDSGNILTLGANLKYQQGDLDGSIRDWQLARQYFLRVGDWSTATNVLWNICNAHLQIGEYPQAFACCQEMATIFLDHGLKQLAVSALSKESFEKVRYGSLDEALHIRQRCIKMIEETGVEYQLAWNYWEMGETLRVYGDLIEASAWFERARPIFEKFDDQVGYSFYYRGMADVALARQDFQSAKESFGKSVEFARAANYSWVLAYVLSGLARTALALDDLTAARKHFREALALSAEVKDKGIALVVLSRLAEFYASSRQLQRAVELASLVEAHFASWHETRKRAATLLASVQASLPAPDCEVASRKGHDLELWGTVQTSITELEKQTAP